MNSSSLEAKNPSVFCGSATTLKLQSKGLSRVFSNTTIQKRQFFGVVGYADDLAVFAAAFLVNEPELSAYSKWREDRAVSI